MNTQKNELNESSRSNGLPQFYRIKQLVGKFNVSKSQIYIWIDSYDFPKPIHIGGCSLWEENEVINWMNKNIAKRDHLKTV